MKHMSLYHERRFNKLGYSAASILQAFPLLQLLAYFTKKITLPFLNCIEKCNQEKFTCWKSQYKAEYNHVIVADLKNQIQKDAFTMMCVDAAGGMKLQCGREYEFGDMGEEDPRAKQLYKLSKTELEDMQTNNINAKRNLAIISISSRLKNQKNTQSFKW